MRVPVVGNGWGRRWSQWSSPVFTDHPGIPKPAGCPPIFRLGQLGWWRGSLGVLSRPRVPGSEGRTSPGEARRWPGGGRWRPAGACLALPCLARPGGWMGAAPGPEMSWEALAGRGTWAGLSNLPRFPRWVSGQPKMPAAQDAVAFLPQLSMHTCCTRITSLRVDTLSLFFCGRLTTPAAGLGLHHTLEQLDLYAEQYSWRSVRFG
jgi:hypothetical protein